MQNTKLLLGYEKFNDSQDWTLNGRLEPSTLILSDVERSKLDGYSLEVYDSLISADHKANSIKDIFSNVGSSDILKKSVEDIQDEKYLYIIPIFSFHVYNTFTSHISISQKARSDINNKIAKIVFFYPNEGHCSLYKHLLNNFRSLVTNLELPKEQIYFVHGDLNVDNYKNEPYTYIPINNFAYWLYRYRHTPKVNYNNEKLFLHYSRNLHTHRIAFTILLENENLLDDSIYSFGKLSNYNFTKAVQDYNLTKNINRFDFFKSLENKSSDYSNIIEENPAAEINISHYEKTFLSIVSETIIDKDVCFFSEKIYKPLCVGHPFILIGSPYQLEYLRKLNYRTFNDFWDESYDTELDPSVRLRKIILILKQIKKMTKFELEDMRKEMESILIHNQYVVRQTLTHIVGIYHQTEIYKTLKNIHDR